MMLISFIFVFLGLFTNGLTQEIFDSEKWVPVDTTLLNYPNPPVTTSWDQSETEIFIGISSYRDKRCPITLNNIFTKAKYPERIRIGRYQ